MKTQRIAIALTAFTASLTAVSVWAAPLVVGTEIGVDFGLTASTNDFNDVTTGNGTIAAGGVIDTSNVAVDGVGFSWASSGGAFLNDDADETQADQPSVFDASNLTDWLGNSGGGINVITLTFTGLDDALAYDLDVGAAFTNDLPDTLWAADGQSATTDADVVGSSYVSFIGLTTDGSGNLEITATGTDPRADIPAVAALALTAVVSVANLPGDTDGDGFVDNGDLATSISNFTGPQTDPPSHAKTVSDGDTDTDGAVDNGDLATSISNFTGPAPAPVPEPTSLALLGLGGLVVARRRRA